MAFTRGTTPVYSITFSELSLSDLSDVYITFEQKKSGYELTKHGTDLTWDYANNKVQCVLSQAETLKFASGDIKVQIRAIDSAQMATATEILDDTVDDVLYEAVI